MKKEFIGYYDPTEGEIRNSWTNGVFSFDANTLLNLYRYTELTRNDFLDALKTLKGKLFLPHQAALEYHINRIAVIERVANSYTMINDILTTNFEKVLKPHINQFKKHPAIQIEAILKLGREFLQKISDELDKQKKNHPDFMTDDNVLNKLTELFDDSVGREFSKQELKKIFDEGKERYSERIPPGFRDAETKQKKGERNMYGDFIIWKELINHTKKEKKPIVFVTDDRKEDWWTIEDGKTIRPREELIKEFFDQTGIRILIYNADSFLHYAKKKNYLPNLKDNTIKEVKGIRVSDENSYFNSKTDERIKLINDLMRGRSIDPISNLSHALQFGLHKEDSLNLGEKFRDLLGDDYLDPGKKFRDLLGDDYLDPGKKFRDLLGVSTVVDKPLANIETADRKNTIKDNIDGNKVKGRDLSSQNKSAGVTKRIAIHPNVIKKNSRKKKS
jgi:hypothetical protein